MGLNPTGPAISIPLQQKAARNGLICPLACGAVLCARIQDVIRQVLREIKAEAERLLADRIAADKSVNRICKELGIGKQTFYSWAEEYQLKR